MPGCRWTGREPNRSIDRILALVATVSLAAAQAGCRGQPAGEPAAGRSDAAPVVRVDGLPSDAELFSERTLDFVHFNGMSGEYYFAENMGSGGAMLDYDNDGDLDLFLLQGHMLGPGKSLADATFPPQGPLRDRLLRNDLEVGDAGGRRLEFVDVTESSGIDSRGYGMGVAAGDFDNDGWIDLYVTNFGDNQLFRNNGDGTFSDVTAAAGASDPGWSTSAAFVDFDRDGWLDLYVCNYVDFRYANHRECFDSTGAHDYCSPNTYPPLPDRLLRNRGDGTFEDVSLPSQIARVKGAGLGVVTADLNGDGWIDIFVANDSMANHYWVNQGDGTFQNRALLAGLALNADGRAEASMGVDAGDFDADGDEDLFMTHLEFETNTLYANDGSGLFVDRTTDAGLGAPSRGLTGFGTAWFDLNNDGWLDLFVANGAVLTIRAQALEGDPYPLRERNQLFLNLGNRRFAEIGERAGPALERVEVSRGAAFGDVDNDGDVDLLVLNNSGPARLLLNEIGSRNPWLGLRLVTGEPPRDVNGATVAVVRADAPTLWRRARSDASYCSASDPRIVVGLGGSTSVDSVRVYWPDGAVEEWVAPTVRRWTTFRKGSGRGVR